jgi:hypothetical protein
MGVSSRNFAQTQDAVLLRAPHCLKEQDAVRLGLQEHFRNKRDTVPIVPESLFPRSEGDIPQ